ncbi:hypothetical protein DY000_02045595 [Brassica cretica]|uniref:Uncharacterized protein n=1 Tax=Brassica cretica TaxID=69181 RepID=A0ABQ7EXB2_BRACR|nr:hypothetical protein DY000_02045595 [Brassica cretica]
MTVTSSNHRSFTELIHDDVELGIHGVAHWEEELTRFDRSYWFEVINLFILEIVDTLASIS